jgi:hypothetical protein
MHVHQHDVGSGGADRSNRIVDVTRSPDDWELFAEFGLDTCQEQLVVVDEEELDVSHDYLWGESGALLCPLPVR